MARSCSAFLLSTIKYIQWSDTIVISVRPRTPPMQPTCRKAKGRPSTPDPTKQMIALMKVCTFVDFPEGMEPWPWPPPPPAAAAAAASRLRCRTTCRSYVRPSCGSCCSPSTASPTGSSGHSPGQINHASGSKSSSSPPAPSSPCCCPAPRGPSRWRAAGRPGAASSLVWGVSAASGRGRWRTRASAAPPGVSGSWNWTPT
mmetsp:Transcript_134441/g.348220  ORF Transcript_134441/g.348220 Transcript_134441/m.348220 type:complete len:201 (+) Transcript_134441:1249-1851(+)